ncbi:protealysin inhibitor emfourin [Microbacterium sp. NPDC055910]|uniref:protealysin inhibitor emfourin n=1 Tax=Microbacterium sp. NPDC055910 TaxID=3345659 RepID=UPI0035DC3325
MPVVVVTRTGGVAGMRRAWRAEPGPDEAPVLIELIEQCPWDAVADPCDPPRGADRFVWRIHARCDDDREHDAELADAELTGAWRALVDAVRAWGS